jgi:spore coat protein CotH
MKKYYFTFLFILIFIFASFSQNPFPENGELFRDDIVPRIDITINPDSLKLIVDKTDIWSEHEYLADFIFDNGHVRDTLKNIGFRLRGNTSRSSQKKSFKVSFNSYEKGRKYYGVEKLNLNGEHNDPSIIRTKLCCDLAKKMGIISSRANHVKLFINGNYFGLYINVEHIDEEFVKSRFGNNDGNLYKCTYPADLNYKGTNPELYKFDNDGVRAYELKTNEEIDDYSDIADLIYKLNFAIASNFECELDKIFNVEDYIKIMVFDILTGNWDGYAYNKNNFYLYHNSKTGKFEYLLYDLDNTYGIDWFDIDWSARNIYSWSKTNEKRPLFTKILDNPIYKSMFTAQLKKMLGSVFIPAEINQYLDLKRELIKMDAAADTYRTKDYGFTYSDFYNSFDEKINFNHVTFGIKDFISRRYFYSYTQLNNSFLLPIVSMFSTIKNQNSIFFEAKVDNPNLMSELNLLNDAEQVGTFKSLIMNDKGVFPDKTAGDHVYTSSPINYSGNFKYYFSIKDINQQINFFPSCIPQEFSEGLELPKLAINEFMANNDNIVKDNAGDYDDWIEIYNFGDVTINLGSFYITDNKSIPSKWKFPDIKMEPSDFLILWADDEEDEGENHCNFKLNADGEYIGIFDKNSLLIDEYSFSKQDTDQSEGRLPDGLGAYKKVNPTPGYANKPLSINEFNDSIKINIFPNPAFEELNIETYGLESDLNSRMKIFNLTGQVVTSEEINLKNMQKIDISDLSKGYYLLHISNNKFQIITKIIVN